MPPPALPPSLSAWREHVEAALAQALAALRESPDSQQYARLLDAMDDALRGGKRMRAMLVHGAARAAAGRGAPLPVEALAWIACALESWHAYSLVHDDLPAMDDDDERRGRPSCHRAHGEGTAILAGDALQTLAFEWLCRADTLSPARRLRLVATLAECGGYAGMAGGQMIDLDLAGRTASAETSHHSAAVRTMQRMKTAALMRGAARMGGIAVAASAAQLTALERYGENLGMAFQLRDDILDIDEDQARGAGLSEGIEDMAPEAQAFNGQAMDALAPFGADGGELRALARFAEQRTR